MRSRWLLKCCMGHDAALGTNNDPPEAGAASITETPFRLGGVKK